MSERTDPREEGMRGNREQPAEVDRLALPKSSRARPALETAYVAQRNSVESGLVRIWEDVLAVVPIGMDDDFFDLGGESLQAFAVIARVLQEFTATLSPRDLFECATVSAMAAVIAAQLQERGDKP
jgi:acyl carrier protein